MIKVTYMNNTEDKFDADLGDFTTHGFLYLTKGVQFIAAVNLEKILKVEKIKD